MQSAWGRQWASNEFGAAELGDKRRTDRLVKVAAGLVQQPAGTVTSVFRNSADREGAYRMLANLEVKLEEIRKASTMATVRRCAGRSFVFVPVDGSTLTFTDEKQVRELGKVGTHGTKARGLEAMTAIAVEPDGTPAGLLGQTWWRRTRHVTVPSRKRKLSGKETRHWLTTIAEAAGRLEAGGGPTPWFQLDRGGDFREMLAFAQAAPFWITFRAAQDRRILAPQEGRLWEVLAACTPIGTMDLAVAGRDKPMRTARTAHLELRAAQLQVRLKDRWTKKTTVSKLWAVLAREVGTAPEGEEPIEWLLWTNRSVHTPTDAELVVFGYTQRWRIEEMHKTWKSVCGVEDSQLWRMEALAKWATLGAAVAMRTERLKRRARTEPDVPATEELTRDEIDAAILLREPDGAQPGDTPSLATCVEWIAEIGGYTGLTNAGGPPGSIVLGRGMQRITHLAAVLPRLRTPTGVVVGPSDGTALGSAARKRRREK
jgi:hypothetical protein